MSKIGYCLCKQITKGLTNFHFHKMSWNRIKQLWTNVSNSCRCLILHFFSTVIIIYYVFIPCEMKRAFRKHFTPLRCLHRAVLLVRYYQNVDIQADRQTYRRLYMYTENLSKKKRLIWLVLGYAQHTFLEFISDGSGPKLHTLKNSLPNQKRMRYS